MAGFRLAPVAARRRRNPWQRRRVPGVTYNSAPAGSVSDNWSLEDYNWNLGVSTIAHRVAYNKTVSDGFSLSDAVVGANPSSGTASGGLIFLFSQGTAGSAYTRTASDGFTISDSVSRVLVPVTTSSFARTCTDGFALADDVSGSVVSLGADATLVGVDLEFTALLETELVFVGE